MKIRNLKSIIGVFFTSVFLSACMRTDYTGKWKTSYEGKDMIYDFRMESYELEISDALDATQHAKFKGVLYVNKDTLTFMQSEAFDYATNTWNRQNSSKVPVLFKVSGDHMTLTYSKDMQQDLVKIK